MEQLQLDKNDKFFIEKFLGSDNRKLNSKLNLINSKNVSLINTITPFNSIFIEYFAEMYYSFVLVRKFVYSNKEFLKNLLNYLLKIVHPNIQIFYGLMFTQDQKDEETFNFHCVFEYFNGIDLCNFDLLKPFINTKEELYLKLLLVDKIAQTVSFLYKSGCPHLMLNGRNILINHNLIMDRHQHNKVIYADNSYIYANIIKINEIGSFLKYDKKYIIFSIQNEDIYEVSFHSPELLFYFQTKNKSQLEMNPEKLEKLDVWSFGCLLFELFTEKRPFNDILDKNSLIKVISSINEVNTFTKFNKDILTSSKNKLNEFDASIIFDLIEACTHYNPEERLDFSEIVKILITTIKKFKEENFTKEEVQNFNKKIDEEEVNYFDFPRFENIFNITQHVNHSEVLLAETKFLEKKIEELENDYAHRIKEIENSKLKQQFNKDSVNIKGIHQSTNVGYFIKHLLFTEFNNLFIFDLYRDITMTCNLVDSAVEDSFVIPSQSSIYFSINKKKLFVSGGLNFIEKRNLAKRSNMFGYFYTEGEEANKLNILSFSSSLNNNIKPGDASRVNSPEKAFKKISRMNSLKKGSGSSIQKYFMFNFLEKNYKISQDGIEDEVLTEKKNLYFIPYAKNLIKRSNHSVIELDNYLFYVGGDQSRKCEILDLRNNNFYFIEELNSIHINPILFTKDNKIFSLNFEAVKSFHSDLYIDNILQRQFSDRKRFSDSNSRSHLLKMEIVTKHMTSCLLKSNTIKSISHDQIDSHTKFIFCESFDTSELTSNPKWKIEFINLNLGENFHFDKFEFYKYIIINEEIIYIVGSDKIFNHEEANFKLYGLCFNITNLEFTAMDKRTLLKLDPLKSSLGMSSNIIYYNNNFYYLNCITKKVEKLPFDFLFS